MPDLHSQPITVLDSLCQALTRCGEYNRNDQAAPAVILWPDQDRQWTSLIPKLQARLPHFMALGDYDPSSGVGPSIWVKCRVGRRLSEADWPEGTIPIVYLPGISRRDLRDAESCPKQIQPLVELQYRGVFFSQINARDWTVMAFLVSDRGGLELDVSRDKDCQEAMLLALEKLSETPLSHLRGRRLEASDFVNLNIPDPIRDLLTWLDEPEKTKTAWSESQWKTFCNLARKEYSFNPVSDGELVAAERLGLGQGKWADVWKRFEEAPTLYPNLPNLLARAKPAGTVDLFQAVSPWPQDNDEMENQLRIELTKLAGATVQDAAHRISQLENQHAARRSSVWARIGRAPLAMSLRWLAELASHAEKPLTGYDPTAIAKQYAQTGWRVDSAALSAMAVVERIQDVTAVNSVLTTIYKRWLEDSAERFQHLVMENPISTDKASTESSSMKAGTCILFADGLRYDVAKLLQEELSRRSLSVDGDWTWAALPTVTPTAKPASSPVSQQITGDDSGEKFQPILRADGKTLSHNCFQRLLSDQGIQVLSSNELGDPVGMAWSEIGALDKTGHEVGCKLARRIEEELRAIAHRVESLLEHGWNRIEIVTDHGWLLVPGGSDKAEMPGFLVEDRWARCALPKPGVESDYPRVKWHWNPDVEIIVAPGAKCFKAGVEYAHGGLSVQECVIPRMVVTGGAAVRPQVTITSVRWVGLRCRVEVVGASAGCTAVLRTRVNDPASDICTPREIVDNEASLLVGDIKSKDKEVDPDTLVGEAAAVVICDPGGGLLARKPTFVGE